MGDEQFRDPNRRAFARTVIRQPATLVYGNTSLAVQTLDLGEGGMCLVARRPIGPGTRCTVTFEVPLRDGPVAVSATLKVVYSSYEAAEQFKIGAVFTELDDDAARALARFAGATS
ncbi:MAG: PilZ domain-containing protein [Burkholderiales bacterium]|nr:PilZ domain-containing protein [Burkholderiales bacterium]